MTSRILTAVVASLLWTLASGEVVAQGSCPFDAAEAIPDSLDPKGYAPFQIGNVWEYEARFFSWLDSIERREVIKDTLIADTLSWKVSATRIMWPGGAIDPYQPGAEKDIATRSYYQVVESGMLVTRSLDLRHTDRFQLRGPFNACHFDDDGFVISVVGGI